MDRRTISRLDAINRAFYERHAARFDATRRQPWMGWERVIDHLSDLERPTILDVGCGNGRFGLYAERRLGRPIDYVGVDRSRELIERGRERGGAHWRWLEADLVAGGLVGEGVGSEYDLVACFGLMHHLPGQTTRRDLLVAMSRRVAPSGFLAVSFWQLGEHERFTRRAVAGGDRVASEELEAGDYLLPWGDDADGSVEERLRFCHHVDSEEADKLLAGLGLERHESFRADGASGDLNLYRLLRRAGRD